MGVTLNIRDVDPDTKARLTRQANRAGLSLAAYLRLKLDEMAGKPRRAAGVLADQLSGLGEPQDGWAPLDGDALADWEADEPPAA